MHGTVARLILSLVVLLSGPAILSAQPGSPFQLPDGCTLPFENGTTGNDIDQQCGPEGDPSQSPAPADRVAAQNRAKNNFCAGADVALATLLTFNRLEKAAEASGVAFGDRETLPADRSPLMGLYTTSEGDNLGEGSVVVFVGFLVKAKTEPGGESVNCGVTGAETNDFHIELSSSRQPSSRCNVVVAEMSPHFRPEGWNVKALNKLRKPVRVTGQLFFDASHKACKNGQPLPQQPVRNSLWEIHPVYGFDVCANSSLSACRFDDDAVWTALTDL